MIIASDPATSRSIGDAPLFWMAAGSFAIGTEGFMIAALLPAMAADLSVSVGVAGQLVAAFALTYAVSSPLLTTLTGSWDRRRLLILCMAAFAAGNVLAGAATNFTAVLVARLLLAAAAGLYVPNANALASASVRPEHRGRALAIVTGGLSVAVALGVPLGAFVGAHLGWRMTFFAVALIAAVAGLGLIAGLPRGVGTSIVTVGLRERLAPVRRIETMMVLLVTAFWAIGTYSVYTYIALFLSAAAGIDGEQIGLVLFLWGAAASAGLLVGGRANDRFGSNRVVSVALPAMAIALAALSVAAFSLTPAIARPVVLVAVGVWGFTAWAFFPAQQARLIGLVGPGGAPIILSLNASFQYASFSLGAVLGALVLAHAGPAHLGWVGALSVLGAVAVDRLRPVVRPDVPATPRPATAHHR